MRSKTIFYAAILASNLGYAGPLLAEDSVLPEPQTQNGIHYVSGGVGSDQVTAMKAAAGDYSLMLTFATQPDGQYLSAIQIRIADQSDKTLIETTTDGPILLAKLDPGTYHLSANNRGALQEKTVLISAGHATQLTLYWSESLTDRQDSTPQPSAPGKASDY